MVWSAVETQMLGMLNQMFYFELVVKIGQNAVF